MAPTDDEIHSFAVDTANEGDSPTGKIIHIAAFETGAKWMRHKTQQWIHINEQRPEIAILVLLLCSKGRNWLGFRVHGGWNIITTNGEIHVSNHYVKKKIDILYWLPIPVMPNELYNKLFPR